MNTICDMSCTAGRAIAATSQQVRLDGPMEPSTAAEVAVLPAGGELFEGAEVFLGELRPRHKPLGNAEHHTNMCI